MSVLKWQLDIILKMIRGNAVQTSSGSDIINGWRDIRHSSLHFNSLQKRAHLSLPAVRRWFELAPPSPQRMSFNDANLRPFWQDLGTRYVGQLPVPCWFYQYINIESTGTGGKKRKEWRKDWVKKPDFFPPVSVTDLQPHLLLRNTIGAEDARRHRCLGWDCVLPNATANWEGSGQRERQSISSPCFCLVCHALLLFRTVT